MPKLISLLISLFLVQITLAQEILPFTENYNKQDYKGDNQIWSLVQGDDNALYFANNHYFLRYNGVRWEKYSLPNKTIIRSVFAYGDKIYTGSLTEFGYWVRTDGIMNYHSLIPNPSCFNENSANEEIWKIFEYNKNIYFQSFNDLYCLYNSKIKKINLPSQISYCFPIENKLYAASITNGIYIFQNNKFEVVEAWSSLKGSIVHAIDQYKDTIFIFTQKDGVFVSEKDKLTEWNHPINEALKNEVIITARFINNDRLVIGTASNGVYIIRTINISTLTRMLAFTTIQCFVSMLIAKMIFG